MNKSEEDIWFPNQFDWSKWDDFIKNNYCNMTDKELADYISDKEGASLSAYQIRSYRVDELGLRKDYSTAGKLGQKDSLNWNDYKVKKFLRKYADLDWVRLAQKVSERFEVDVSWITLNQKQLVRDIVNHAHNRKDKKPIDLNKEEYRSYIEKHHPKLNDTNRSMIQFVADFILHFDLHNNPNNVLDRINEYVEEEFNLDK